MPHGFSHLQATEIWKAPDGGKPRKSPQYRPISGSRNRAEETSYGCSERNAAETSFNDKAITLSATAAVKARN
jgi:hypothetical protein